MRDGGLCFLFFDGCLGRNGKSHLMASRDTDIGPFGMLTCRGLMLFFKSSALSRYLEHGLITSAKYKRP